MKKITIISLRPLSCVISLVALLSSTVCRADVREDALAAAKKATLFLTKQVSIEGGYLWTYSADLALREGEGVVTTQTVWVQPPGTPTVGETFLRLYDATRDEQFLDAARDAGEALRRGQMRSGGWQAMIEFEPARRRKWAYRTDQRRKKARDQSSLDDDKTQSALRFVMQLDRALQFEDTKVHEMARYALDGLIKKGQLPNGGFPQVWTGERQGPVKMDRRASHPDAWPRTYQGHQEYWYRYTLNDNLAPDVIRTLLLAEKIYDDTRYRQAALRLADSLLLAQMPVPQPAWAQQYSFAMQPIWARKFEPPAITGGESQGVIETLLFVYRKTGDRKYLAPIPKALDYLKKSELADGKLARFYELKTNRPLYFTKDYELTYDDSDLPTHYAFKVTSRVDKLRKSFQRLSQLSTEQLAEHELDSSTPRVSEAQIRRVIDSLDSRGAWVTEDGLRYHKKSGLVIDMRVAVTNLKALADYLRN